MFLALGHKPKYWKKYGQEKSRNYKRLLHFILLGTTNVWSWLTISSTKVVEHIVRENLGPAHLVDILHKNFELQVDKKNISHQSNLWMWVCECMCIKKLLEILIKYWKIFQSGPKSDRSTDWELISPYKFSLSSFSKSLSKGALSIVCSICY